MSNKGVNPRSFQGMVEQRQQDQQEYKVQQTFLRKFTHNWILQGISIHLTPMF